MAEKKRIDDDWKKRAAEEKARPASAGGGEGVAAQGGGGAGEVETDQVFVRLVSTLGGQAMMALGLAEDPHTGQRFLDLDLARQSIDMLGALEKKSRGNCSEEEETLLGDVLHQLRLSYTQRVQAAQQAAMREGPGGEPGAEGPAQ